MTPLPCVVSVLAWVALVGVGCKDKVVLGLDFHVDTKGRPLSGVAHSHSHHISAKSLENPKPLEPTELPNVNASNTSYSPQGSYSRPYRLVEVMNTSSLHPSSNASSNPDWQVFDKRSGFDESLSSPAHPRTPYLFDPNTTTSHVSSPAHAPPLRERVAGKEFRSPGGNYTAVNHSIIGYALPNWERAPRGLTTQGNYSRVYRLPSWESSLSLFGVMTNSEVRISLLHADNDDAPVNITLFGRDEESEIQFNLSSSGHVLVSPYKQSLSLDDYTWFTIFRKAHVVYVFLAKKADPFLVYEHSDSKFEFLKYTRFQVWSKGRAYWDFIGRRNKKENKYYNSFPEKSMLKELDGIEEGLAERFGLITNLVSVLQRPTIVSNLTLPEIQEITDIGESVIALRNILFFYGAIDEKKMHWTST